MNTQMLRSMAERTLAAAIASSSLLVAWTAVRPARDRASETCLSNLRKLGLASRMYVDDYAGRLVPYAFSSQTGSSRYSKLLMPYVNDVEVYHCPADHLDRPRLQASLPYSTTYGVNWYISGSAGTYAGSTVSQRYMSVQDPVGTVWAVDTACIDQTTASMPAQSWREDAKGARTADIYYFYLPNNPTTGAASTDGWSAANWSGYIVRPFPRHHGMVNCAFFDGHASAVSGSQFDPAHNPDAAWGKPGCIWDNPS